MRKVEPSNNTSEIWKFGELAHELGEDDRMRDRDVAVKS